MQEIEILRAGTFPDNSGQLHTFAASHLDEVVSSYNPANFRAPLIVTHEVDGNDKGLADHKELAFGAPKLLKRVGDRVKAVFESISPKFVSWVREGNLLSISPSFYLPDSPNNPSPGKLALRHIAALGKTPPAIKGLAPLSLSEPEYGEAEEGTISFAQPVIHLDNAMTTDFAQRQSDLEQREAEIAAREAKLRQKELADFAEGLIKAGKLLPAQKPQVVAFMSSLSADTTVDFGEEGQQPTQLAAYQKLLTDAPKLVEFGEVAGKEKTAPTQGNPVELAKQATAYRNEMLKQGIEISFAEAVSHITGQGDD
ncbi:hypothetical protein GS597_09190 [Synechococcales cyanobacterium C]|uniref:Uncharacterized protein n=1 Tax=Petrachloros mirabilis ULC683 TaxID=2781853 RepID=A0A8K1ZZH2_9CYAN|nr:hypothetical protein [Petrachloros mirabilis]NCJ06677.1 hypothetical protein [Petrachloros mirabilis ULC683]